MITTSQRITLRDTIGGYAQMVKSHLDNGWTGYMLTFMFNQVRGNLRQQNRKMQTHIENTYASLLTRLQRRPTASGITPPILLSCPDFPVTKHPLPEVLANDGLHHHGLLLIPPGRNRLKVSVPQHFADNQSHYLRDPILKRIDVSPITHDADRVTDYVMKGLKAHRLLDDETLLILPKSSREITVRPYRTCPAHL